MSLLVVMPRVCCCKKKRLLRFVLCRRSSEMISCMHELLSHQECWQMRWKMLKKNLLLLFADASTAPSAAVDTIFTGCSLSLFSKLPGSGGTLDTNFRHNFLFFWFFCYFPSLLPFWLWRAHRHFDTVEIFFSKFNPSGAQFCFTKRHCSSPPIRTLAEKHSRRPNDSKKSRKTRKLCNLELFLVFTHPISSLFLFSNHTILEKSSFHCQPDNANVCCVGAFLPSIHWVRFFF